ncbi:MAG: lytic transglycosylase domain-containing protein [Oscillospiraceae bacterium]
MKKVLTVVAIVVIVLICVLGINRQEKNLYDDAYPMECKEIVLDSAKKYDLQPSLLFALIYTESSFKPDAVSNMGAVGLTQITEQTFDWIKWRKNDNSDLTFDDVKKPEIAVDYGAFLLKHHIDEFGTVDNALCAYNAGRGNLIKWLDNDEYSQDTSKGRVVVNIPFGDTKAYVEKINKIMLKYQELYNIK